MKYILERKTYVDFRNHEKLQEVISMFKAVLLRPHIEFNDTSFPHYSVEIFGEFEITLSLVKYKIRLADRNDEEIYFKDITEFFDVLIDKILVDKKGYFDTLNTLANELITSYSHNGNKLINYLYYSPYNKSIDSIIKYVEFFKNSDEIKRILTNITLQKYILEKRIDKIDLIIDYCKDRKSISEYAQRNIIKNCPQYVSQLNVFSDDIKEEYSYLFQNDLF